MTYDAIEQSVDGGFAVELYSFQGTFSNFFLTSYAEDFEFNGQVYKSTAGLQRKNTDLTVVGGSSSGELEISMPFQTPVALAYAFADAPPSLLFTLRRGHVSDTEFRVLWTGQGGSWVVKGATATLKIPSTFSRALNSIFPPRRWQAPCNHLLYDNRCGVSRASFSETTTVLSVTGESIRLNALSWTTTEGVGGEIINNTTGERRTISSHTADTVRVKLPFTQLNAGDSVTVFQGCDHSPFVCRDKFNNLDNYGGFPLVPTFNPFLGTLR